MMKLYTSQGSRAQIIEWYAKEKGLQFESVSVDMRSGAHKQAPFTDVNPFGKMPAIQAADGTPVFESGAILLYMAALSGEMQTPENIGTASKWVLYANATYWPEVEKKRSPPPDQLQALETILSKQSFLAGENFTVSDAAVGSYLYYTKAFFGEQFQKFPKVQAYLKGLMARPCFQETCGAS
jgi:glutathione S-transferase